MLEVVEKNEKREGGREKNPISQDYADKVFSRAKRFLERAKRNLTLYNIFLVRVFFFLNMPKKKVSRDNCANLGALFF